MALKRQTSKRDKIQSPILRPEGDATEAVAPVEAEIPDDISNLRQRAVERLLKQRGHLDTDSPEDLQSVVHELRVHRIELEMQNHELRCAQQELEASREKYFDLYDMAPVGYVTLNKEGIILEANLTTATLLGKDSRHLIRQPLASFISREDQDIYYRHSKQLFETREHQECEVRMLKGDGTQLWARFETVAAKGDSEPLYRTAIIDITRLKKAENLNRERLEVLVKDRTTELTVAEQDKMQLQDQLLQAQKMESVGRLAGGVAHDFNNLLTVILGNAEFGVLHCAPSNPLHSNFKTIEETALRAAAVTKQLLTFARKQAVAPKVIDVNDSVTGVLKMLKRLIGEDIYFAWHAGASLWPVKIDPSQLDQLLANLCVNARDAITGVGKIAIETKNVAFDDKYCADHPGISSGEYVMLSVIDNGKGIDRDILDHIFEPFFATKDVGKGTGLGLAMVYGIVKQNNGFIKAYSESGKGTTFEIYLPKHVG